MDTDTAHTVLSEIHLTPYTSLMPFYPYLQPVCDRGIA